MLKQPSRRKKISLQGWRTHWTHSTKQTEKDKQLIEETGHEFIEWCGEIGGGKQHEKLKQGGRIYKNDLYLDFVEDNPDFAPKSKFTVSRTNFYKWLTAYSIYKYNCKPESDRDSSGRWLRFRSKHELEVNGKLDI